jgi:hypothetical protein
MTPFSCVIFCCSYEPRCSFSVVTRLRAGHPGVGFPAVAKIFLFDTPSRPALGHPAPIQWVQILSMNTPGATQWKLVIKNSYKYFMVMIL